MALLDVPIAPYHPRQEEQQESHAVAKNNIGAADIDTPIVVVQIGYKLEEENRNENSRSKNKNFRQIESTCPRISIYDSMYWVLFVHINR